MKNKTIKIFGIGAVVLLLLMVLNPATTAAEDLENNEFTEEQINGVLALVNTIIINNKGDIKVALKDGTILNTNIPLTPEEADDLLGDSEEKEIDIGEGDIVPCWFTVFIKKLGEAIFYAIIVDVILKAVDYVIEKTPEVVEDIIYNPYGKSRAYEELWGFIPF